MVLHCPGCRKVLHRVEMSGFHVDECRGCDGIWLENGQPEALVTLTPRPETLFMPLYFEDSLVAEGSRLCPKCDVTLTVYPVAGQSVDACEVCRGLWLDRRELQLILKPQSV